MELGGTIPQHLVWTGTCQRGLCISQVELAWPCSPDPSFRPLPQHLFLSAYWSCLSGLACPFTVG